jgi:hypothetical protein
MLRIRDIMRGNRIRILGSVQWITDLDPDPDSDSAPALFVNGFDEANKK